jgi:hypothetical protein
MVVHCRQRSMFYVLMAPRLLCYTIMLSNYQSSPLLHQRGWILMPADGTLTAQFAPVVSETPFGS